MSENRDLIMPCPFCGAGNAELQELTRYQVVCMECSATGPEQNTQRRAIHLWNGPTRQLERARANLSTKDRA